MLSGKIDSSVAKFRWAISPPVSQALPAMLDK